MAPPRLRIAFMGTPDFAVRALDALARSGHEIVCAYSQPPRPAGRGHRARPSAVHRRAEELGIPVRTPGSLKKNAAARAEFAALDIDVAVVAAYGLILPQDVLDAPRYGCVNIHASLLPRWRGAAPIQRAILAGDARTGVGIMQMEAGLDTGPVLLEESMPITDITTAQTLHDDLADMGARLIVRALDALAAGTPFTPRAQAAACATYAAMLTRDDGRVDWTRTAEEIGRQVRALTPWPGVWCEAGGQRLKIHAAEIAQKTGARGRPGEILDRGLAVACGEGSLRLLRVQPENRKAMDGASFMNGAHLGVGDLLS